MYVWSLWELIWVFINKLKPKQASNPVKHFWDVAEGIYDITQQLISSQPYFSLSRRRKEGGGKNNDDYQGGGKKEEEKIMMMKTEQKCVKSF